MQIKKFQEGGKYTIKKGDTLSKIAKSLTGNINNWKQIADYNNIQNPNMIKEGDVIIIPQNNQELQESINKRTDLFNRRDELEGLGITYGSKSDLKKQIDSDNADLASLNEELSQLESNIQEMNKFLNNQSWIHKIFNPRLPDYYQNPMNEKYKSLKIKKDKLENNISNSKNKYNKIEENEKLVSKNLEDIENNERNIFLNEINNNVNSNLTFNQAFANARSKGLNVFEWNGNMYTTETREEAMQKRADQFGPKIRPVIVPLKPLPIINSNNSTLKIK